MTQQRICTALLVGTVSALWALSGSTPAVLADHGDCLGTGSCFEAHDSPGCNDRCYCTGVCHLLYQEFCCEGE
ncbi:MAG: hypothetical protein IID35_11945, partial [Planctomycetes bacterium]|nr:hypothetical protein [Planctomycetota bacterium]